MIGAIPYPCGIHGDRRYIIWAGWVRLQAESYLLGVPPRIGRHEDIYPAQARLVGDKRLAHRIRLADLPHGLAALVLRIIHGVGAPAQQANSNYQDDS